jgi:hypothetical protein
MKHVIRSLFYLFLVSFTFDRIRLFSQYLVQFRKEYNSDVYAYNEICRNIIKINDMGRNADFCKNIDIRVSQGPYVRAFEKLYSESTGCGEKNCIDKIIGPLMNNSNFLIFFTLVCVFLYVISKFVPFFTYFFRSDQEKNVRLVNYSYSTPPVVGLSQNYPRLIIQDSRNSPEFIPALHKLKNI